MTEDAMTAQEFDRSLRTLVEATPYRNFGIELNNGQRFEIDLATALAFRDGVAVFLAKGGRPTIFNHRELIAIHHPG
jgi:hypothetical protein